MCRSHFVPIRRKTAAPSLAEVKNRMCLSAIADSALICRGGVATRVETWRVSAIPGVRRLAALRLSGSVSPTRRSGFIAMERTHIVGEDSLPTARWVARLLSGEVDPRTSGFGKVNATDVLETLADVIIPRGPPAYVRSDNGPEFIALTPPENGDRRGPAPRHLCTQIFFALVSERSRHAGYSL